MFSINKSTSPRPSGIRILAVCISASLVALSLSLNAWAQAGSSSSSSTPQTPSSSSLPTPRIAQPEAGGSAVTLETSEPLFDLAVALNTCGYDADLAESTPVRAKIREEINGILAASAPARDHRDALCDYIRLHTLNDSGLNLAQYVSLSLYLNAQLNPTVSEAELPPDSTQVVNVLPLLRNFSQSANLHAVWIEHRPEYEELSARVHDPLTKMILNTNIFLRQPVSSYDGRRFLVLLEPMLAPTSTNARIYANDYIVVVSPASDPSASVHMDQIRHTYLHYVVEPLVYARAAAVERLAPLLKAAQEAPLEFTYRSDIMAFMTECLIKSVEIRTMDTGLAKPKRPDQVKQRLEIEQYNAQLLEYDRQSEAARRKSVALAVRHGWFLAEYFYDKLGQMEKENSSLKEYIGEMVYGMDVDRERRKAQQIDFVPDDTHDIIRRTPRQLAGLDLAETKLIKGDLDGAEQLAKTALADPRADHARAYYVQARVDLLESQPDEALRNFDETLKLSKDPRTLAWAHIYRGRLYDVMPDRQKALAEYHAALTVRDAQPDTKAAAEKGIKEPFIKPGSTRKPDPAADDDAPIDPSGKAEKDAYRPPAPQ